MSVNVRRHRLIRRPRRASGVMSAIGLGRVAWRQPKIARARRWASPAAVYRAPGEQRRAMRTNSIIAVGGLSCCAAPARSRLRVRGRYSSPSSFRAQQNFCARSRDANVGHSSTLWPLSTKPYMERFSGAHNRTARRARPPPAREEARRRPPPRGALDHDVVSSQRKPLPGWRRLDLFVAAHGKTCARRRRLCARRAAIMFLWRHEAALRA